MFTQTQKKKQKPTDECRSPFSKTTHTTIIKQNLLRFRFVFCCKQASIKGRYDNFYFLKELTKRVKVMEGEEAEKLARSQLQKLVVLGIYIY